MTDEQIIKALECFAVNKDNDIVKALELCITPKGTDHTCAICPLHKIGASCKTVLNRHAIELINRQKAEIEKLKEAYAVYEETTGLKQARAEAIKEFVERLEADLGDLFMVNHPCVSATIDNLVKEMTEEQP